MSELPAGPSDENDVADADVFVDVGVAEAAVAVESTEAVEVEHVVLVDLRLCGAEPGGVFPRVSACPRPLTNSSAILSTGICKTSAPLLTSRGRLMVVSMMITSADLCGCLWDVCVPMFSVSWGDSGSLMQNEVCVVISAVSTNASQLLGKRSSSLKIR